MSWFYIKIISSITILIIILCLIRCIFPRRSPRPSPRDLLKLGPGQSRGGCQELNTLILNILKRQILEGNNTGCAVSSYLHGELLVNVCIGGAEMAVNNTSKTTWQPIDLDTLFMSWSVCKGLAATTILTLVDQGVLKYEQTVASIWPEFGQNGKQNISVQCALAHRAGLSTLPKPLWLYYMYLRRGWKEAWCLGEELMVRNEPEWHPGSQAKYHAVSWSWLAGGHSLALSLSHSLSIHSCLG